MLYTGRNPRKLIRRLEKYKLVSFDVFDTLILRSFRKPTDLFVKLEKKNGILGFHDMRMRAEAEARKYSGKPNGEVNIFDIYERLARECGFDAREMALREYEEEKKCCYANPDMEEVFRVLENKKKRMIAVSDMYLGEKWVSGLLDSCGYGSLGAVYVSCDRGMGKYGGMLLHKVRRLEGNPIKCIHIGDSRVADVSGGKLAGWDTVWYLKRRRFF